MRWLEELGDDLAFAIRQMRTAPGFALVAADARVRHRRQQRDVRAGRRHVPAHRRPPRLSVVVLSEAFWRGRFGGDPALVGGEIRIGGVVPALRAARVDAAISRS